MHDMPALSEVNKIAGHCETNKIAEHGELNNIEEHCKRKRHYQTWRNNDIDGQGELNKRSSRINSKRTPNLAG
jgi:hypothetical protein